MFLLFLIVATLLGLLPASIAHGKGREFAVWWIYGAFLFIVALPHAMLLSADTQELERRQVEHGARKCPHCAEVVKAEALVCRFCQRDLPPLPAPRPLPPQRRIIGEDVGGNPIYAPDEPPASTALG